jgi:hypothetical protein
MRHYIPRTRSDQSWILWILAELELAWLGALESVIRDGVASGEFTCQDPVGAAERLDALLNGLMVRNTVHPTAMSRKRLLDHVRTAAAREVGLDRGAFPA